ncbi:hypothetical protein C8R46DRAFT_1119350 [Mycena filopes]|nr:hypothetical protein C8R46DRAFT_1119350 [Mycena filopes]
MTTTALELGVFSALLCIVSHGIPTAFSRPDLNLLPAFHEYDPSLVCVRRALYSYDLALFAVSFAHPTDSTYRIALHTLLALHIIHISICMLEIRAPRYILA